MKREKSSAAEVQKRIDGVYEMILRGYNTRMIHQYGTTLWKVTTRQVDNYIKEARLMMLKASSANLRVAHATAVARLEMVLREALKDKDYKTTLAAIKELNVIQGLNRPFEDKDRGLDFYSSSGEDIRKMDQKELMENLLSVLGLDKLLKAGEIRKGLEEPMDSFDGSRKI